MSDPKYVTYPSSNETTNSKPQKRRIFDPNTWEKIDPEIEELESKEMIRESPIALGPPCNIVAVRKKNSSRLRIACDFTSINKFIEQNHHPMPAFEELIMNVKSFEVVSGIDISEYYLNYKISERSKELTNFYVKDRVM